MHYPENNGTPAAWRLVSINDSELGHPALILASLNQIGGIMTYPWPRLSPEDPFAVEKSTILLSLGFTPLLSRPPYADESHALHKQVSGLTKNYVTNV